MSEYNMSKKDRTIRAAEKAVANNKQRIIDALTTFRRNNISMILQIIFDQRYMQDEDLLYEYSVLEAIQELHDGPVFSEDKNLNGERYGRFVVHPNPSNLIFNCYTDNGRHKLVRYGYLDSDVLLHLIYSINHDYEYEKFYMEPSPAYNSLMPEWNYWTNAMWVERLEQKGLTPKTWFSYGSKTVPDCKHGWIVKGMLKSARQDWHNRMFASTREELQSVLGRLYDDTFISRYGLMIREYVPLMTLGDEYPDNPEPYKFCEWRVHIDRGVVLSSFYYWNSVTPVPVPPEVIEYAKLCYEASEYTGWACVDVARKANGDLICIEMNCGPIAGVGDPLEFWISYLTNYKNPLL